MKKSKFQESWEAFAIALNDKRDDVLPNAEPADIKYLRKIGAHEDLIMAAQDGHLANNFNIAPGKIVRKFSPDWIFKNSIPIGQDACGNYALWMDGSKMDCPILFVCHDPSEVVVLAKSPADFFDDLKNFLTSNSAEYQMDLLDAYLEKWEPNCGTNSGVVYKQGADMDVFDFSAANVGDSVSLIYRGEYTIVSEAENPGVLTMTTEQADVIKKLKRRDRNWNVGFFIALGVVIAFFYFVKGKSILASLGWTMVSLLVFGGLFMMIFDEYYIWKAKLQGKS